MNSQPSSVSTRSIVRVGGGAPATTMRVRAAAGDRPVPRRPRRRASRRRPPARRTATSRRARRCGAGSPRRRPCAARPAAPPIAVTAYGMPQPLQWNIGNVCRYTSRSRHRRVPAERRRVEPEVAVGELHALGPRGRAARVVDRRGRVLVGFDPRLRLAPVERTARRRSRRRARSGACTSMPASASSSSGSTSSTDAPECSTM